MSSETDRIEKQIVLRAPRGKVWRALTDARQFGAWFRAALEGDFVPGQWTRGRITYPGYEHHVFEALVEAIEPERYFAMRWHPYPGDPPVDVSAEPTTLVEFTLDEVPEGTRLRVVESGFDRLPPGRRDEAFRMNDRGWAGQMSNIERFLAEAAPR
jgi:uncharacterized protein YndB with AHSA1/START domain